MNSGKDILKPSVQAGVWIYPREELGLYTAHLLLKTRQTGRSFDQDAVKIENRR